jgi:ATP-dependent 26S proteasome regulatory subunit
MYNVCEDGVDYRRTLEQVVRDGDDGRELLKKREAEGKTALVSATFLGTYECEQGRGYAMVTRGQESIYLPAAPDSVQQYQMGEAVLVDLKAERVVGRDGQAPIAGDVVPVNLQPPDKPGHVIVTHHDRRQLARLHHSLLDRPDLLRPGKEVVYDPATQFVLAAIDTGSSGEELLVDPNSIANVRCEDVGAPKPVVGEILARARQFIERPDWIMRMNVRQRCSYLFVGGTGSGKSYHLKLIANGIHDLVEEYTGERASRLVIVDASQFWTPLFGETEQRIVRWTNEVQALGSQRLRGRDGSELQIPLIIALEECEGLLRSRGDMHGSGHLFDRPLALLLQKIESLESTLQVPIIWIMSSNRSDLVDAAALRRLGMRQVHFGSLRADEALAVLKTKIPPAMPIFGEGNRKAEQARSALFRSVIGYLYGPEPKQAIAEVRLGNSERRMLNRRDVVTPAVLEEAVSAAVDRCLRKSNRAGELLGLDAADVVGFLHKHFVHLGRTLRPHNVAEHATEWFERDRPTIAEVVPLVDDRRPAPFIGPYVGGNSLVRAAS